MDSLMSQNQTETALKEMIDALKVESMKAMSATQGYALLLKRMIKNGQRPSDIQIIQMMDEILESNHAYRAFMEGLETSLGSRDSLDR